MNTAIRDALCKRVLSSPTVIKPMTSQSHILTAALLVITLALTGYAQPGFSHENDDEAKALEIAAKAKQAFRDSRFDEAAKLFKTAYSHVHEPTLIFNAGRAYQEGEHLREALSLFRLYLDVQRRQDGDALRGRKQAQEHVEQIEATLQERDAAQKAERVKLEALAAAANKPPPQPETPTQMPASSLSKDVVHKPGLFNRLVESPWTKRKITAASLSAGGATLVLGGLIVSWVASGNLADIDERLAQGQAVKNGLVYYGGVSQREFSDALEQHNNRQFAAKLLVATGAVAASVGIWLWWQDDKSHRAQTAWMPSLQTDEGRWAISLSRRF